MDCCSSEGAYIVAAVDHKCGAAQYGFHDFDRAHDPELASEFSLIGVLVFWFAWNHPSSLDILRFTVVFNSKLC